MRLRLRLDQSLRLGLWPGEQTKQSQIIRISIQTLDNVAVVNVLEGRGRKTVGYSNMRFRYHENPNDFYICLLEIWFGSGTSTTLVIYVLCSLVAVLVSICSCAYVHS